MTVPTRMIGTNMIHLTIHGSRKRIIPGQRVTKPRASAFLITGMLDWEEAVPPLTPIFTNTILQITPGRPLRVYPQVRDGPLLDLVLEISDTFQRDTPAQ